MAKGNAKAVKVEGNAPEFSVKYFLNRLDPAKMSREEILAYAAKAREMEEILSRTRESERRRLFDLCGSAFSEKAEILGLEKGNLDHIAHVIKGLTTGVSFVEFPRQETLTKFFDKVIPGLVSGVESFDFTHYVKVGETNYMVRIRPKAERTKKADKAD